MLSDTYRVNGLSAITVYGTPCTYTGTYMCTMFALTEGLYEGYNVDTYKFHVSDCCVSRERVRTELLAAPGPPFLLVCPGTTSMHYYASIGWYKRTPRGEVHLYSVDTNGKVMWYNERLDVNVTYRPSNMVMGIYGKPRTYNGTYVCRLKPSEERSRIGYNVETYFFFVSNSKVSTVLGQDVAGNASPYVLLSFYILCMGPLRFILL